MAKKKASSITQALPAQGASFIFRGTVQRTKDSAAPGLKGDARALVVRVDEVMAAPPVLARVAGTEIAVVGSPSAMRPGEEAVFHASSVSFGDEVAVRAARVQPLESAASGTGLTAARALAAPLPSATDAALDPVQAHRDLVLKRSLDSADLVVAGTITEVRMAPETLALASAARTAGARASASRKRAAGGTEAAAPALPRISEHDPIWQEALVHVESVEKGSTGGKQVVVRFPGSNDVRWRNHPKLRPGQQGVFLLSAESARGPGEKRAVSSRPGAARLTTMAVPPTLDAANQATSQPQPISSIERIRLLLKQTAAVDRVAFAPASSSRSRSIGHKAPTARARKKR
jgi:hypothetical protein